MRTVRPRLALALGSSFAVAALLTSCPNWTPPRIVDCAPGYHNSAGPDSDCVPNTPSPSASSR